MTNSKTVVQELFQRIIQMKPTRVKLGFGSFITIDFGRDIPEEVKTKQGKEVRYHGEWHLWVYQCDWQVVQNGVVLIRNESPKAEIESVLAQLAMKSFTSFHLLNNYFDIELKFEDMTLKLLHTSDGEQWMLFTPENKTFVAGPDSQWDYRDSG